MMRLKQKIFWIFVTLCCAVGILGCSKGVFDCSYTITVYEQQVKDSTETLLTDGVVYVFYADTMHYEVDSWENASRGLVKNRHSSQTLECVAKFNLTDSNPAIFTGLNQEKLILLVCNSNTKTYAWKAAEIFEGLSTVVVPLHFRSWQTEYPYIESEWIFNK